MVSGTILRLMAGPDLHSTKLGKLPGTHVSRSTWKNEKHANCGEPRKEMAMAFGNEETIRRVAAVHDARQDLERENRRLRDRIERLEGWLALIEGGDNPQRDERILRGWAYQALVLDHEPHAETS